VQDGYTLGYTLECVDVHGGSETAPAVLMHSAVCYASRQNDNPSFGVYFSPLAMPPLLKAHIWVGVA
jgi:hypothetical protein